VAAEGAATAGLSLWFVPIMSPAVMRADGASSTSRHIIYLCFGG
jgi:hypothetical protein